MNPWLSLAILLPALAVAKEGCVLKVGPEEAFKTPSAAAAVAKDDDVIEIQAGVYPGDVAVWTANRLTLRGVSGMAQLKAEGKSAQQKAIWVIRGDGTTVEHIGFSGCHVPDHNGAGIRLEGCGLVVRHCHFHDNEDGILTDANPASDVVVEFSEFDHNGAGDGYSHNLYIGQIRSFTLTGCHSHDAKIGHLVKSRAQSNKILSNLLTDGPDGTSSLLIDLPNGGDSLISGNILQHGPLATNGTSISYASEGSKNEIQSLRVVNNTSVNQRPTPGPFLHVYGNPKLVKLVNNLVVGTKVLLEGAGDSINNLLTDQPGFVNPAKSDYRLIPGSPALGAGKVPSASDGFSLPAFHYLHPMNQEPRDADDKPDIGAMGRLK